MKKLKRTDNTIDYVKLLAEYSQKSGIAEYSEEAIRVFGDDLQERLSMTANTEHRLRGLRAEALFLAIVAGIGSVKLIKAEDAGEVYYTGDDILIPDFRVITAGGTQILVEVKAQRMEGSFSRVLKLSDSYIKKLLKYSEHAKIDLKFAIFWEDLRIWTLNSLEAFTPGIPGQSQWSISFLRAFATSEMLLLGDCTIATLAPLRFRVHLDPFRSDPVLPGQEGTFKVTLAGMELLSQDRVLSGLSAQIAWRLLWYGSWEEVEQQVHHEGDRLVRVDRVFGPRGWEEHGVDSTKPIMIGSLSEMICRAYLRGAERTIHTVSKDRVLEPGHMGTFIPHDFVSMNLDLPLYVLQLQPNFTLDESSNCENSGDEDDG